MEFTAQQLAQMCGGTVDGDPNARVSTIAKIEEAAEGSITFLANPKYTPYIYTTGATIVIVSDQFRAEEPVRATLLRVADPYGTVARLLDLAARLSAPHPVGVEEPAYISADVERPEGLYVGAFSYVAEGVTLGSNVKIYPQAYVGARVKIGDDTVIYPGAKIYHDCEIGARCIIHAGAVIGADGFGFAPNDRGGYDKIAQTGNVVIADDVEVGANTTIDRATMGSTVIGRGVKLDNMVQIAHNVTVGEDTVMAAQCGVAGSTHIGSHCVVAGQVGFAGHIRVGDNVTIGAKAGVPNSIKEGRTMMGYPAVDARAFLRQSARIKHLDELFERVDEIEKTLKQK